MCYFYLIEAGRTFCHGRGPAATYLPHQEFPQSLSFRQCQTHLRFESPPLLGRRKCFIWLNDNQYSPVLHSRKLTCFHHRSSSVSTFSSSNNISFQVLSSEKHALPLMATYKLNSCCSDTSNISRNFIINVLF